MRCGPISAWTGRCGGSREKWPVDAVDDSLNVCVRGCRRAYQRFYIRGKAIFHHREQFIGVYTVDASRQGLCFLAPMQMFPKERCRIRLPKTKEFQVQIVRCRRVDENFYVAGCRLVKTHS